MTRATAPARLVVDPVRCEGVGICAYVANRLVDLDRWGYPIVPTWPLDPREQRAARAAAAACPRRALLLEPVARTPPGVGAGGRPARYHGLLPHAAPQERQTAEGPRRQPSGPL